jgi:pyridoxine 5-phosphate synthase
MSHMPMLSVNLNKVALLRNARRGSHPSVLQAAAICLAEGAGGITVHPRPDARHTRASDVRELAELVKSTPGAEFNVEGNPTPEFLELVQDTKPIQCTLVPDPPDALTSDHGWDLEAHGRKLRPIMERLRSAGIRVSLFVEPEPSDIERAKALGADRVELYTEPYARGYGTEDEAYEIRRFAMAAEKANEIGLGVNAGHDLNLDNLPAFCAAVPHVLEVSIGHAFVSYSLEVGLQHAVRDYLRALSSAERRAKRIAPSVESSR